MLVECVFSLVDYFDKLCTNVSYVRSSSYEANVSISMIIPLRNQATNDLSLIVLFFSEIFKSFNNCKQI